MPEIWFTADQHFRHANILKFNDRHGCFIRPEFADVDKMDEHILTEYNKRIAPTDIVYILGDVTFRQDDRAKKILQALNGNKTLILGNHDDVNFLHHYLTRKIKLWAFFLDVEYPFIASHIPLREDDMRKAPYNVHGHLHEKNVMTINGVEDHRYLNVGVEQMGYKPIHIEEIQQMLALRGEGQNSA